MQVGKAAQVAVLMLSPTMVVAAMVYAPRWCTAAWRTYRTRHTDPDTVAAYPPIERVAADLRRLLLQHEALRRSAAVAVRAGHLAALEAAITDCATDAARALRMPYPARPVRGPLAPADLRRLLRSLADAGLVLPPSVGLLSADKRL